MAVWIPAQGRGRRREEVKTIHLDAVTEWNMERQSLCGMTPNESRVPYLQ
jgi:hypothetical protein